MAIEFPNGFPTPADGSEPWIEHGGEIDSIAQRYGLPRDHWLDLSTGINPNAYPVPALAGDYWRRLPDSGLMAWLEESAAEYYGVAEPDSIAATPGSQAAIQWLPRLLPRTRVCIIEPTYGEHRLCWAAAGHEVLAASDLDAIADNARIVIAGNPNNPDGRVHDPERLLGLARDRLVIVDEAFADSTPEISLAGQAGRPGLIVLRSMGKFFGLAGMRLGFALGPVSLIEPLRRALGPWAVSGPAAAVGAIALADSIWVRDTRVRLAAAAARLDGTLIRARLTIRGGTSLFRLAEHAGAADLFEHLATTGILARRFAQHPTWLRFGLPGNDLEFDRLLKALGGWSGPGRGG